MFISCLFYHFICRSSLFIFPGFALDVAEVGCLLLVVLCPGYFNFSVVLLCRLLSPPFFHFPSRQWSSRRASRIILLNILHVCSFFLTFMFCVLFFVCCSRDHIYVYDLHINVDYSQVITLRIPFICHSILLLYSIVHVYNFNDSIYVKWITSKASACLTIQKHQ